jgi:hypothetical protein
MRPVILRKRRSQTRLDIVHFRQRTKLDRPKRRRRGLFGRGETVLHRMGWPIVFVSGRVDDDFAFLDLDFWRGEPVSTTLVPVDGGIVDSLVRSVHRPDLHGQALTQDSRLGKNPKTYRIAMISPLQPDNPHVLPNDTLPAIPSSARPQRHLQGDFHPRAAVVRVEDPLRPTRSDRIKPLFC